MSMSAAQSGLDPIAYLDAVPHDAVGEIILPAMKKTLHWRTAIDTHGAPIVETVWLARLCRADRARPVRIERDTNIPAFDDLLDDRRRADPYAAARGRSCLLNFRRRRHTSGTRRPNLLAPRQPRSPASNVYRNNVTRAATRHCARLTRP